MKQQYAESQRLSAATTAALISRLRESMAQSRQTVAQLREVCARSREAKLCSQELRRSRQAQLIVDAGREPEVRVRNKRARPNKLVYKDRWLISCDVVAALRRAGVICSIVVPSEGDHASQPLLGRDSMRRPKTSH
jgi:hypothetical protein